MHWRSSRLRRQRPRPVPVRVDLGCCDVARIVSRDELDSASSSCAPQFPKSPMRGVFFFGRRGRQFFFESLVFGIPARWLRLAEWVPLCCTNWSQQPSSGARAYSDALYSFQLVIRYFGFAGYSCRQFTRVPAWPPQSRMCVTKPLGSGITGQHRPAATMETGTA
jgi:hypothetical protein